MAGLFIPVTSSWGGAGGMCCSVLLAPQALQSSGWAPHTAQEMLWSKRWGGSAPLPSRAGRGAQGSPEVHGVGGWSTDGAARPFFGELEGDK